MDGLTELCAPAPAPPIASRGYPALPGRVKGSRSAPAAPPLTRPTLAGSGETGRPGWAGSGPPDDRARG
jgi:hypothetical protein